MNFIKFYQELKKFPVFSISDANKLEKKIYPQRFVKWQKKGYIKRLANQVYFFSDAEVNEEMLFYAANYIYEPSYVSLESALRYYDLIPESVYTITSVSGRKTSVFNSDSAVFSYKKIKNNLMFGYTLLPFKNTFIKMAEPEKAILDFLYLNPGLNTEDHLEALRINIFSFNEKINYEKMENYLSLFNNKKLRERVNKLKKVNEFAKS